MKRFLIVPSLVLAVLLALCILNAAALNRRTNRWMDQADRIAQLAEQERWDMAREAMDDLSADWESAQDFLHVVIHHETLDAAQVTLTRQQALAKTQAISKQDLDTATTELAVKQAQIGTIDAQIKRNQASLDTAKTNLDYTKIVAPMAGEVTQITTLQGQTVIAAQQAPNILTLADMSTMLVKAQVSEADVIHLRPGQNAWFTVLGDPQTRYEGVLKDILPTPEKVNDAIFYYARFEVPNPQGVLRLDMTAQVHIQLTGVKNVLTVPLSALGESAGDNRYKVKVLRNGETREREVVIGARNDTDVVVVKGLEEGEEVVTSETLPGAAQ